MDFPPHGRVSEPLNPIEFRFVLREPGQRAGLTCERSFLENMSILYTVPWESGNREDANQLPLGLKGGPTCVGALAARRFPLGT